MSDKNRQDPSEDASEGAIRTSFSLDRLARSRIRGTARTYGVSQAEIVNRSSKLFAFLAERSLQRRSKNLSALKTLAEQIQRSLNAMEDVAPHLRAALYVAADCVWGAVHGEEQSIASKHVFGAEAEGIWAADLDLTDEYLIEKVLEHELPELGPQRWIDKSDDGTASREVKVSYDPFGDLSTGRIEEWSDGFDDLAEVAAATKA